VLAAMPSELGPLLAATKVERTVETEGRTFYVGTLRGNDVALGLTHIGMINSKRMTNVAYRYFRCDGQPRISRIVFSGVSGGDTNIGDVTVPNRWRYKVGGPVVAVDRQMLASAKNAAKTVKLARRTPAGDPTCTCIDPNLVKTVKVGAQPRVLFDGLGVSADPFNGRRFPCWPNGGNVFGCEPCKARTAGVRDVPDFVQGMRPFLGPGFFRDYFNNPTPPDSEYMAEDMETAAVARIAASHGTPFIAFRALSDGDGDPLRLPGFPVQFFYYQELAAQNAGTMAIAFLTRWAQFH
jgi:nucleoside phosphorylase